MRAETINSQDIWKKVRDMIENDKTKRVTRVEVIDDRGRAYTMWDVTNVELSLQDDERTLKVFVTHKSPTLLLKSLKK